VSARRLYRRLAAILRGGWRPALGWSLTPCVLYAFVVGPWLRRPADAAQLVALAVAAGTLVAARSFEKTRGLP
jgi:hypothetical protein